MPVKVKQEDGSEIDAFTAEELQAQVDAKSKEASEAAVAAATERLKEEHEGQLLAKDEVLQEAQEKIEKLKIVEGNFKILRDKADKAGGKPTPEQEAEAKKVADDLKRTNDRIDAIEKQPFETAKSTFTQNNIGADKELGEKFDFFFKKLSAGAKTLDEYNTALDAAFLSASGGTKQPNRTGQMVRTGVNQDFAGNAPKAESQDSQNFGVLLGITPEDKKNLAGKKGLDLLSPTPLKESK